MNYGIFGNLGTWNRMFPFTFKPRKFGCFELVTMATEKIFKTTPFFDSAKNFLQKQTTNSKSR